MNTFSRRAFGAGLLGGAAAIGAVPGFAAADTPHSPDGKGTAGSWNPTAQSDEQLTQAFRAFGNSGGGWSDHGGWAASDGVFSTVLPGRRIIWLMNDTFLGPVNADESMTNPGFIHGSILLADRRGVPYTTITAGTHSAPESIASPPGAVNGDPWYWNSDGIVDGGKLRVFQGRIGKTDGEPPWNFGWLGSDIVTYAKDFSVERITETYGEPGQVNWGNELVRVGGHIYIYGQQDGAAYVARCRDGHLVDRDWQFYTGDGWSTEPDSAAVITDDVGASYSVTPMGGRFVLTTTATAIFTDHKVYVASAPSPVGPFGPRTAVFTAPEGGVGNLYAPYNVAAHPGISRPGELTISYNVNSGSGDDLLADANNNRPRFVRIKIS